MMSTPRQSLAASLAETLASRLTPRREWRKRRPSVEEAEIEELFHELDTDSSGDIDRSELKHAMQRLFGKAMDSRTITKMMHLADADGNGEISLEEFKRVMRAADEKGQHKTESNSSLGLWYAIRERGPGRLIKASEQMKQRRLASTVKRIARIEHVLEDELARHPEDADVIDLGGVASRPLPAAATPGGAVAAGRGGSSSPGRSSTTRTS